MAKKEPIMDVALLIKERWCNEIFDHQKTLEIRGDPVKKRGRFAIAASGTGTLVGEATLVDCLEVGKYSDKNGLRPFHKQYKNLFIGKVEHFPKHRIKDLSIVTYANIYAWVLDHARRYETPIPYKHNKGALKWVKI